MAKMRTMYNCGDCGASHHKWAGKCDSCGEWNSLVEDVEDPNEVTSLAAGVALVPPGEAQPINKLNADVGKPLPTGISEPDRILDGGLVPGSLVAKPASVNLHCCYNCCRRGPLNRYTSPQKKVRMRAERLHALRDDLWFPKHQLPTSFRQSTK